jgi:hypothetical protein
MKKANIVPLLPTYEALLNACVKCKDSSRVYLPDVFMSLSFLQVFVEVCCNDIPSQLEKIDYA